MKNIQQQLVFILGIFIITYLCEIFCEVSINGISVVLDNVNVGSITFSILIFYDNTIHSRIVIITKEEQKPSQNNKIK